jgi:hypothetical protein
MFLCTVVYRYFSRVGFVQESVPVQAYNTQFLPDLLPPTILFTHSPG